MILEHEFYQIPKYLMKILLGDVSAMLGKNDIFKPPVGNESLHETATIMRLE
jgi:hypothetical protein